MSEISAETFSEREIRHYNPNRTNAIGADMIHASLSATASMLDDIQARQILMMEMLVKMAHPLVTVSEGLTGLDDDRARTP